MIQTPPTSNFNRADMAAMLSAMTREEQQWTLMYLNSIIYVHPIPSDLPHTSDADDSVGRLREPNKPLEQSMGYLKKLCVRGSKPVPADIDDFGLFAEKYA